jgi:hypothetical protein
MKKIHRKSLKFHSIYSIAISIIFLVIIASVKDITLGAATVFLLLYIVGNGIIHTKNNELARDTLIEYALVSAIVLIIILGATR